MDLLNLPLEIHQRIISYLLSNRDVAALSIQCRFLHSVCDMANRQKFHRINISESESGVDEAFNFLLEILKQPQLALYVRHVEYHTVMSWRADYKEAGLMRDLKSEEMDLIRKAVRKGGFIGPKEDRVVNMLMQRTDSTLFPCFSSGYKDRETFETFITQALTAIIIAVSPNIVSMVTTNPMSYSDVEFPLEQFLHQANMDPERAPYLCNLRSVYMISKTDWEDERFYTRMDLYGFLKLFNNLLSIESVSTDAMEEDDISKYDVKKKSSKISKLSINHSSISSAYLARLIWSSKALKELQYSIGGRASNDGGYPTFNAKTFIKAICDHKDTIAMIDIDVESDIHVFDQGDTADIERDLNNYGSPYENGIGEDDREFLESIWKNSGSLKEFVSLKRLSLGVNFLLYFAKGISGSSDEVREKAIVAHNLPNSLEYLCVRGYEKSKNEEHDEQMDALMAFYKSGKSQLKELRGIEETIPHADHVHDPDEDEHLLWSFGRGEDDEDDENSEQEEEEEEDVHQC